MSEEEGKKKAPPTHTNFTCQGGPLHGVKLRVYADNAREVRLGGAPEFSPVPMTDGSYHVENGKLRWITNPNLSQGDS